MERPDSKAHGSRAEDGGRLFLPRNQARASASLAAEGNPNCDVDAAQHSQQGSPRASFSTELSTTGPHITLQPSSSNIRDSLINPSIKKDSVIYSSPDSTNVGIGLEGKENSQSPTGANLQDFTALTSAINQDMKPTSFRADTSSCGEADGSPRAQQSQAKEGIVAYAGNGKSFNISAVAPYGGGLSALALALNLAPLPVADDSTVGSATMPEDTTANVPSPVEPCPTANEQGASSAPPTPAVSPVRSLAMRIVAKINQHAVHPMEEDGFVRPRISVSKPSEAIEMVRKEAAADAATNREGNAEGGLEEGKGGAGENDNANNEQVALPPLDEPMSEGSWAEDVRKLGQQLLYLPVYLIAMIRELRNPPMVRIHLLTPLTLADVTLRLRALLLSGIMFILLCTYFSEPEVAQSLKMCGYQWDEKLLSVEDCTCSSMSMDSLRSLARKGVIGWCLILPFTTQLVTIARLPGLQSILLVVLQSVVYAFVLITANNAMIAWVCGLLPSTVTVLLRLGLKQAKKTGPAYVVGLSLFAWHHLLDYIVPAIGDALPYETWRAFLILWPLFVKGIKLGVMMGFKWQASVVRAYSNEDIAISASVANVYVESLRMGSLLGFTSTDFVGKLLNIVLCFALDLSQRWNMIGEIKERFFQIPRKRVYRATRVWNGAEIVTSYVPWIALYLQYAYNTAFYRFVSPNCSGQPLDPIYRRAISQTDLIVICLCLRMLADFLLVQVFEKSYNRRTTAPAHNFSTLSLSLVFLGLFAISLSENEGQLRFFRHPELVNPNE